MKAEITSRILVPIDVTFDYDPHSMIPVTNIKLDSATGWELSKEVVRAFDSAKSKAERWCSDHAESNGGWKRPWTEGGQEDPPPAVCELFNAASYDDLSKAEKTK